VKRTVLQNKSLHKYLSQIAEDLASSGYDMKEVVSMPITPNMENVKECIWRRIQLALYPDRESSSDLTTIEIQEVYKHVDRALSEKFGIHREWPSQESLDE
jgi:hypothetical protein